MFGANYNRFLFKQRTAPNDAVSLFKKYVKKIFTIKKKKEKVLRLKILFSGEVVTGNPLN